MKRIAYLTLAMVLALGVGSVAAQGQAAKAGAKTITANGVVKSVSGSSLTIESGKKTMTFSVDSKTFISARGASTKTREKKAAGQGGLTVADAVHAGDQVVVRYHETGGTMMATEIQVRAQPARPAQKK